ncbi:MAG: multicopper oxidase domain-containing protein [Nitriliruptoraceae bacterium]|nr:multicopper oxidase domain-containing protein [Nitriliruptoraceae bacterium]
MPEDPAQLPPGEDTGAPSADGAGPQDRDETGLSRRELLRRGLIGGAALSVGGVVAHELIPHRHVGDAEAVAALDPSHHQTTLTSPSAATPVATGGGHGAYGHGAPPAGIDVDAMERLTRPPAFDGRQGVRREFELPVTARRIAVADDAVADAWCYGGTVPGPTIRATEGDTVRITMDNRTEHAHNVHLHGRHDPAMDGWEPIPPGSSFTYEIEAAPFGLHPYHCHTAPLAEHVARGLYGAMIVDPPGGRSPAHEVVLTIGGWDLDDDGRNELVCFNGIAGFYARHPIRVPVGELVRVYLTNMLEHEPLASFHLHAQTFDVLRSGTRLEPDEHTDTVTLSQGERAILEFTLPERGRYMFHPHQHHLAERGAMGWFAAV